MTPLQKRRNSTMRQGKRRASQNITLPHVIVCSNCHQLTRAHEACVHCGFYKGSKVTK